MIPDSELLHRYATRSDSAAFAELVRRRIDLVYSIAVRQCGGDTHLAQDVTQEVFADLARKARPLSRHVALTGWLFRATRFAAGDAVRAERRRRARELAAMNPSEEPNVVDASRLRPLLDEILSELNEADSDAVALRYLERRPFAEIAKRLRTSEDAVRMRVNRALEKIRTELGRRGIASTAAALALALEQQAAIRAPAPLLAAITAAPTPPLAANLKPLFLTITVAAVVMIAVAVWPQRTHGGDTTASAAGAIAAPARESLAKPEVASAPPIDEEIRRTPGTLVLPAGTVPRDDFPPPGSVTRAGTVIVIGGVRTEGRIPWQLGLTATQAIEACGGLTPLADASRVKVSRIDRRLKIHVTTATTSDLSAFALEPDDCVIVLQ